jgi:hypothetical protein
MGQRMLYWTNTFALLLLVLCMCLHQRSAIDMKKARARGDPEIGGTTLTLLGTCSQMLRIKNKATRKMLSIKVLRPS